MSSLFRISGLTMVFVAGAVGLAELAAGGPAGLMRQAPAVPPDKAATAYVALLGLFISILCLFAALFWLSTGRAGKGRRKWLPAALVVQLAIGAFFPELMYIVAAEAGYLLAGRGTQWMYVQAGFFLALVAAVQAAGDFSVSPELVRIPRNAAVALTVAQTLGWQLFAFAAGYLAGREAEARRRLSLSHAELQATQQMLADSARISERLNIARDLHDTIGHHLAALSLKLQLAGRLAGGPAAKPVEEAHLIARLLLSDVRAAVSSMREEGTVDLPRAIETICAAIDRPAIELRVAGAAPMRDPSKAQVLLRCVQEAVTNAVRHSDASSMSIRLESRADAVELEVRDNGRGSPAVRAGNGLRGMRERIEGAGGSLLIETAPGAGFRLLAQVPLAEEAA